MSGYGVCLCIVALLCLIVVWTKTNKGFNEMKPLSIVYMLNFFFMKDRMNFSVSCIPRILESMHM